MRWIVDPLSRWTTWLVLASLGWSLLAVVLAWLEPWLVLATIPHPGSTVPLILSALLGAANVILAFRLLARFGRLRDSLPGLTMVTVLGGVLFFQIATLQGMQHFHWRQLPTASDWLLLPLAHALRGLDVLDVIDTYRWPIQNLEPVSPLARGVALAIQLPLAVLGFFLLAHAFDRLRHACRQFFESYPGSLWSFITLPFLYGSFAIVTLLVGAYTSARSDVGGWSLSRLLELPGWLLDQSLRVLDLGDAMSLLGLRLHNWPGFWWLLVAGILVRLGVLLVLFQMLRRYGQAFSLRRLNGMFLEPTALETLYHRSAHADLRRLAGQRLFTVCLAEPNRLWPAWSLLSLGLLVGLAGGSLWAMLEDRQSGWAAASRRLASHAIVASDAESARALAALRRLGPYAAPARQVLCVGLLSVPEQRRHDIVRTLGYFGPEAIDSLEELLDGKDTNLAITAIEALGQIGVPAVPTLARWWERVPAPLDEALQNALRQQGVEGLPALTALLDRSTAPRLVPLLEQIDPQWYVHDPGLLTAREVRTARIALALLLTPTSRDPKVRLWARDDSTQIPGQTSDPVQLAPYLRDVGPLSARAVPVLLRQLTDDQTSSYGTCQILAGLEQLGPHARSVVPELVRLLERQPRQAEIIRRTLDRIDPTWQRRLGS
jgi:hypothetical protein